MIPKKNKPFWELSAIALGLFFLGINYGGLFPVGD